MNLKACLLLLLLANLTWAQEEASEEAAAAADNEVEESPQEDCEEAWEYLEFLKSEIKERVEQILQETLFEPRNLLEQTVAEAMSQTLEVRDAILQRTKDIRTGEGDITICPDQGVNQEQFLSMIRMDVMTVLLSLIESDAATPDNLKEIGRQLLSVRTKVNGEITRIIMLRETGIVRPKSDGDCDCGILKDIVDGLNKVVNSGEEEAEVVEVGDEEGAEEAPEETPAEEEEGAEDSGNEEEMSPVEGLTMVLMDIDARIGSLYNEILSELDEEKRSVASEELQNLKEISSQLNEVISKMVDSDPEKMVKLVDRDVTKIRNDVERQLNQCREKCPADCDSCGSEKIEELKLKLAEYKSIIEDLEEEDAKDSVRNDLMQYLTTANGEMTTLLTQKAESENGVLPDCQAEQLKVLEAIKGPLWMMVNITIFGNEQTMTEMIIALESALDDMSREYCSQEPRLPEPTTDGNTCDLEEINAARQFIADIDVVISESLFKTEDDEARKKAMLGFIELKSAMDDRVRQLFNDNLKCHDEVKQLKNVYMDEITNCLAEMMNPRYRFEELTRAERVACIKGLRVTIEDRRGELLMKEIERRISEQSSNAEYEA